MSSTIQFEREVETAAESRGAGEFDPTANAWYVPIDKTATSLESDTSTNELSRAEQLHRLSLMLQLPDDVCEAAQTSTKLESNQRQFARCPMPEDRMTGVVSIEGNDFNCRIVEMSIGGFGVVLEGHPKFDPGAKGTLKAPGLNYVVSVTRQEGRPGGVYVGLKQLEEIVPPRSGPNETSSLLSYGVALFSGAMIVIVTYCLMYGTQGYGP